MEYFGKMFYMESFSDQLNNNFYSFFFILQVNFQLLSHRRLCKDNGIFTMTISWRFWTRNSLVTRFQPEKDVVGLPRN